MKTLKNLLKIMSNIQEQDNLKGLEEFELMDRISIISNNFNDYIIESPAFKNKRHKKLLKKAKKVSEKLHDLYQDFGHITFEEMNHNRFIYEMWIEEDSSFIKMSGWVPIDISYLKDRNRIEEYIDKGLLRKIKK